MDYNIEICKVAHFSSYVSVSVKPVYGLLFPWGKRTSTACFLLLLAAAVVVCFCGRRRRGVQFRLAFNLMISDCKKGVEAAEAAGKAASSLSLSRSEKKIGLSGCQRTCWCGNWLYRASSGSADAILQDVLPILKLESS